MTIQNNITDLLEGDLQIDTASDANEMATTKVVSNSDNLDSKDVLYNILDLDERIKFERTEESDPEYPDEYLPKETESIKLGDFDEILLIEMQLQEEENARIKGYPIPKYN